MGGRQSLALNANLGVEIELDAYSEVTQPVPGSDEKDVRTAQQYLDLAHALACIHSL